MVLRLFLEEKHKFLGGIVAHPTKASDMALSIYLKPHTKIWLVLQGLFCYNRVESEANLMRDQPNGQPATNPYHYVLRCIGGKWKMTILHEIYTFGYIRFNQTLKLLPISEKVLSQQLRELIEDGLVRRISYDAVPPKVEYVLTESGRSILPALDILYVWSIREMDAKGIAIDADNFVVHKSEKYVDALRDIIDSKNFWPDMESERNVKAKRK